MQMLFMRIFYDLGEINVTIYRFNNKTFETLKQQKQFNLLFDFTPFPLERVGDRIKSTQFDRLSRQLIVVYTSFQWLF
jgi:hypothetical protein